MNRFIILLAFIFILTRGVSAQAPIFHPGDRVIVQISPNYGKVYVHEMTPKQTVYSLAKTFEQRMTDVKSVNPGIDFNSMKAGQKIRVPFLAASLIKHPSELASGGDYVPVFYMVRPKDNLYRISKVYFDQTIENLLAINNIRTFDLKIDQVIQVGWLNIGTKTQKPSVPNVAEKKQNIKEEVTLKPTLKQAAPVVTSEEGKPIVKQSRVVSRESRKKKKKGFFSRIFGKKKDKEIKEVVQLSEQLEKPIVAVEEPIILQESPPTIIEVVKPTFDKVVDNPVIEEEINSENLSLENKVAAENEITYKFKSEKGVAIWNQTSTNSKNMFVLHPTAAVGSYIEITNPMLNKTVQAKVIGNIPPRTYTDDVSIVVSPRVAKLLGVVDRRFMVKLKYRE